MTDPRVWVFFYGSYMNPAVLAEAGGLAPSRFEVARLDGYDIRIAPRANLVPSLERSVYGVLAEATHAELGRLYAHAKEVLGEIYLPHPVLTHVVGDGWRPALCYICPSMAPGTPDDSYVERIVGPARAFGFPDWYISRLEQERRAGLTG